MTGARSASRAAQQVPATAELRVQHSTCECAVAQIKPMWDRHGRHGCLVCEDCYGRIARADKMSGQNARPGEVKP